MPGQASDAMSGIVHRLIPPLAEKASARLPNSMALYCLRLETLRTILEQAEVSTSLDRWLTRGELRLFSGFALPKRRLEWLGGRITAKVSLHNLLGSHAPWLGANRLEILPDRTGRPHLTALETALPEKISLSISHSGGHAAALACLDRPCGLDIQQLSPALKGIKERFSTSAERRLLQSCPRLANCNKIEQLALLWSAKEAFRKALPLSPLPGFHEMELTAEPLPQAGAFQLIAGIQPEGTALRFLGHRLVSRRHGRGRHFPLRDKRTTMQITTLLSTIPLFNGLSDQQYAALGQIARETAVRTGPDHFLRRRSR